MKPLMTPISPSWGRFCELLDEALYTENAREEIVSNCSGRGHHQAVEIIKRHFPQVDPDATVEQLRRRGASCDCEILGLDFETSRSLPSWPARQRRECMRKRTSRGDRSFSGMINF